MTPLSPQAEIDAGIAIHRYVDPYFKVYVPVYGRQDIAAIELMNLATKLTDLAYNGKVYELELKVPWHLLAGEKSSSTACLSGTVDALEMTGNVIVVDELKTHSSVTKDGLPVVQPTTMMSYGYQVRLYALMLKEFLQAVMNGSSAVRGCYVDMHDSLPPLSSDTLHLMAPCLTLDELYNRFEKIVQRDFKLAQVTGVKITHVSQTLAKRAISLQAETVMAFEDRQRLNLVGLRNQLKKLRLQS